MVIDTTLFLVIAASAVTAFPSAQYGLVIPGGHAAADASSTVAGAFQTSESVKEWEIQHSETSFGGDFGPVDNARLGVMLGYMYAQILNFDPTDREMVLRRRALSEGVDYEDFFLHFSEDTEIDPPNPEHASSTSLFGVPWVVGYTASAGHAGFWLYQAPPWSPTAAWSGAASGGALYVYQFERFDELTLTLETAGSGGTMVIEYPSAVGPSSVAADGVTVDRLATTWSTLSLLADGTSGLRSNGTLRWAPPVDWMMASTHDGSGKTYGGTGPYFGQAQLRDGGVAFVLRVSWVVDSANAATAVAPTLTDVRLRRWVAPLADSSTARVRIPGWDAANDANGDGYVSDAEASSLSNPACTARFRYESRALPWGRMWSQASSWCRIEPSSERLTTWYAEYLNNTWHAKGMGGAYNDDLLKLMGPDEYHVVRGGALAGYSHRANASALVVPYQAAFAAMLERIRALTRKWIAANISARNMFMAAATRVYLRTLSFLLREDYITSATGLTGYFGHLKAWDVAAAGFLGIRSLLQCQLRHGPILFYGVSNRSDWEYEQESCVAQYYLLHLPGLTYLNVWGNRFWYGSGNTWFNGAAGNWWEAGVPMNVAYQPTALLNADIGVLEPSDGAAILHDEEPIQYMVRCNPTSEPSHLAPYLAPPSLPSCGSPRSPPYAYRYGRRCRSATTPSSAGATRRDWHTPSSMRRASSRRFARTSTTPSVSPTRRVSEARRKVPSSPAATRRASCCTARASSGGRGRSLRPCLTRSRSAAGTGACHGRRAPPRSASRWTPSVFAGTRAPFWSGYRRRRRPRPRRHRRCRAHLPCLPRHRRHRRHSPRTPPRPSCHTRWLWS